MRSGSRRTASSPWSPTTAPARRRARPSPWSTSPAPRSSSTLDLGQYKRPHGVTWIDNRRALVTAEQNKALLEVDIQTGKVIRAIPTGQEISHMVAVTPDGSRAFVANIASGSVTAIDLKAGKHLADIKTGAGAEGVAVTPDGKQVWVTNRAADTVTVLDAASLAVLATLESAAFPIRAEATPTASASWSAMPSRATWRSSPSPTASWSAASPWRWRRPPRRDGS